MQISGTAWVIAAAGLGLVLSSEPTEARSRGDGSVTACSNYGKGCVRGAVRRGRVEDEVRMPGGSWIGCKRDCRETLREETVDFWETLRERAPDRFR